MAVTLSLAGYLRALEQDLPAELISPEALNRMIAVAETLPPLPMIGFETRLGPGEPASHFAAAVRAAQGDREILLRWLGHTAPARDTPWGCIHAFCSEWLEPRSPLHEAVSSVWLEYDVDVADHLVPNLFLGIADGRAQGWDTWLDLLERCVVLLTGSPAPSDVIKRVSDVLNALPADAKLFQVGTMVARSAHALRLCIVSNTPAGILPLLYAIGWPGRTAEVGEVLASLPVSPTLIALNLDVGAELLPRIGVECYVDDQRRPRVDPRWQALLDYLVAQGRCTLSQRDALLAWPGRRQVRVLWTSTLICGLNHLKLVLEPGREPAAKAYFGFVHR